MEDINHILYVINGDKETAMLKAEALYEEGRIVYSILIIVIIILNKYYTKI